MKQAKDYDYDTALASYQALTNALREITTLWNETKFGNESAYWSGAEYTELEQKIIDKSFLIRLNLLDAKADLYRSMTNDQREIADQISLGVIRYIA